LNEPMREAQEKLRVERAKRIAELRAKAGKMLKDRKKYGNYKGPRAGKRWR
jgi:hypothetical protein